MDDAHLQELKQRAPGFAAIYQTGRDAILRAGDLAALEQARVQVLGRKSPLTDFLRSIPGLPPEQRPLVGKGGNLIRREFEALVAEREAELKREALSASLAHARLDVTLPARPFPAGHEHLITQTMREVEDIFIGLGYSIAEGPEVELDYYNFTALNTPPSHPARSAHDTFWVLEQRETMPEAVVDADRGVLLRHALRNVWIPVLTTLGTSLRFSLASLPVVESFFVWPGVGQILLQTIESSNRALVTDLVVTLGILFLLINLALEMLFPLLDARLRTTPSTDLFEERQTGRRWLEGLSVSLRETWAGLRQLLPGVRRHAGLPALTAASSQESGSAAELPPTHGARRLLYNTVTNPALMAGTLLVAGLIGLVVAGDRLTPANPYETHGVLMIEGVIAAPPFKPSSVFPWGADPVGRDIQALVLGGARRTLTLAFFAMLARMVIGTLLGTLAGWWRGGWLDRLVQGAIAVWAAFPVTLFALILILALGIQQGMGVFIIGVSVVGWGEIAPFVRGQVIVVLSGSFGFFKQSPLPGSSTIPTSYSLGPSSVSYTHLTLPTIYSV